MLEVPPLASIYYNPTGGCNLRCEHCWVDPESERPGGRAFAQRGRQRDELTTEQFLAALDRAKPLGLRHVKITGGEPFLRRDAIDMIEGVFRRGIRFTVETNGTLLDDHTISRLVRARPGQVAVSLDSGDAGYHDRFRGVAGAHQKALDATGKLVAANVRVQLIMSLTRENLCHIDDLIRLATRLRVASVKLCPVTPIGRGLLVHQRNAGLTAREYLGVYRRYSKLTGPEPQIHVEVPPAFRPLSELRKMGLCRILGLLGLMANGDISCCGIGMRHQELVMGNILENDLETIWHEHPLLVRIRRGIPADLEGICSECVMKNICLGVCRIEAYVGTGSLLAPYWFCDEAAREGFFPAKRMVHVCTAST